MLSLYLFKYSDLLSIQLFCMYLLFVWLIFLQSLLYDLDVSIFKISLIENIYCFMAFQLILQPIHHIELFNSFIFNINIYMICFDHINIKYFTSILLFILIFFYLICVPLPFHSYTLWDNTKSFLYTILTPLMAFDLYFFPSFSQYLLQDYNMYHHQIYIEVILFHFM